MLQSTFTTTQTPPHQQGGRTGRMDEVGGGRLGVVLLDKVNEPVGGGVVRVDLAGAMQLRLDLLTQSLTQLNSEIER